MQPEDSDNTQGYPADGLRIQRQPEESLVGSIDLSSIRVGRLKDPVAIARLGVDFIPPAQTNQSSASNVFEVIEIHGQEDDCDDEDQDVVLAEVEAEEVGEETRCRDKDVSGFVTFKDREVGVDSLHRRKPRKQSSVMGCELSRQLSEPGCGLSMAM